MTVQNYLVIQSDIVTNCVVWDGNTQTWKPPVDATMLIQATTSAIIWMLNSDKTDFVLQEVTGRGDIGFTWDGSICTTNMPKPEIKKTA